MKFERSLMCFVVAVFLLSPLYARIGETKAVFANRVFAITQHGYVYTSKEDRLREALELPYKNKLFMFPFGSEHIFLFKNADSDTSAQGDTIQQHDLYGWEVHAVFYKGKSVMEFYRRHGDPMTVEELESLMLTAASPASTSGWRIVDDSFVSRSWNYVYKDGKLSSADSAKTPEKLRDILPVSSSRFVYVEIPDAVKNDGKFKLSLLSDMWTIEQRNANAKYRGYVAKKAQQKASKSSKDAKVRKGAPQKVNPFGGKSHRHVGQYLFDPQSGTLKMIEYDIPDVELGWRPPVRYDKTVDIISYIPTQSDTAFGYTYATKDGAVRAKLFDRGVLFIDAKFDSQLRGYMEELFKSQSAVRKTQAQTSISSF